MNKKRYLIGTDSEKELLRKFIRAGNNSRAVQRAQAILWSMEGRDRVDLAALFAVKADTISAWFRRWDPTDLSKLSDEHRVGRPPVLQADEKKTFERRHDRHRQLGFLDA
jgi:transposase